MGIMDMFRGSPQHGTPAEPTPTNTANQAAGDGIAGGEIDQNTGKPITTTELTGLDRSKDWFTPAESDAKPTDFNPAALFASTPEAEAQLAQAVGKLNFMDGVATPEVMQAIQAGGDDAIKVLPQLFNKVAQNAFGAALKASMQISQTAFTKASPAIEGRVNDLLKHRQIEDAVKTANPVLNHPSGKVIADALVQSFSAKYPNATKEEIQKLANQYITDIASTGVPAKETGKQTDDIMATDWGKFWSPTAQV